MLPTFACMLALAAALEPTAQDAPSPVVRDGLGAKLDDYLTRCAAFGFSGAALVETDGEIVIAKGYGLAEREPSRPNAVDTIFDIGSLTKQFTAAAILRLEQEKKLATSDPISKFVGEVPGDKAAITLHHLLTHTSGLPRAIPSVGSELHDRGEFIRALLASPLETKPGTRHSYSNVGYDLLGAIVEIASERSFEELLRESLFAPAGMASTGFRNDGALPAARAARGYGAPWQPDLPGSTMRGDSESPWDPSLATEGWYSWGLRGAGGVLTTVHDLERWQDALDGESMLSAASKRKLFEPFLGGYAYGWNVTKTDGGEPWIEHGGTTGNGFDCKFTRFPEDRLLLIVLGNVTGGIVPWVNLNLGKLARGEDVAWPPEVASIDDERARALAGEYEASGARFVVSIEGGRLVLEAESRAALEWMRPPSSTTSSAVRKTEEIARGLAKNDFDPLHAAESKSQPLFFFDRWWRNLQEEQGELRDVRVLGVVDDPSGGTQTLVKAVFANGVEILRLGWNRDVLVSTMIGPPYPSRVALQATSAKRFVAFDLVRSTISIEAEVSGTTQPRIGLVAGGRRLALARR